MRMNLTTDGMRSPKTLDYLAVLAGCDANVAVDSHLHEYSQVRVGRGEADPEGVDGDGCAGSGLVLGFDPAAGVEQRGSLAEVGGELVRCCRVELVLEGHRLMVE